MTPKSAIHVSLFDPRYFIFNIGISLLRYEEEFDDQEYIRKELCLGFLLFAIRFSQYFPVEYED